MSWATAGRPWVGSGGQGGWRGWGVQNPHGAVCLSVGARLFCFSLGGGVAPLAVRLSYTPRPLGRMALLTLRGVGEGKSEDEEEGGGGGSK